MAICAFLGGADLPQKHKPWGIVFIRIKKSQSTRTESSPLLALAALAALAVAFSLAALALAATLVTTLVLLDLKRDCMTSAAPHSETSWAVQLHPAA